MVGLVPVNEVCGTWTVIVLCPGLGVGAGLVVKPGEGVAEGDEGVEGGGNEGVEGGKAGEAMGDAIGIGFGGIGEGTGEGTGACGTSTVIVLCPGLGLGVGLGVKPGDGVAIGDEGVKGGGNAGEAMGDGIGIGCGKGTGEGTGKGNGEGTGKGTGEGTGKGIAQGPQGTFQGQSKFLTRTPSIQHPAEQNLVSAWTVPDNASRVATERTESSATMVGWACWRSGDRGVGGRASATCETRAGTQLIAEPVNCRAS